MNEQRNLIPELRILRIWTGLERRRSNQKHLLCEKWRRYRSQYSNKYNFNNPASSGRSKTKKSEDVSQTVEENPTSCCGEVFGDPGISLTPSQSR